MKHRVFGKKLGRNQSHRQALFKNLARSFFIGGGKLKTTLVKAKAVQGLIEKMISRAGKGDLPSRRWLFKYFQDQNFVNHLVATFGKQFKKKKGGCTKIKRLKKRKGDNAIVAKLELIEDLRKEGEKKEPEKEVKKETKKK